MYNAYAGATPRTMSWLQTLVSRYDPVVLDDAVRPVRVRVVAPDEGAWDVVLAQGQAMTRSSDGRAHALITADAATWRAIVAEPHGAIDAYLAGRLSVRHNLHVGVGFLSATSGTVGPTRMRFRSVATRGARLSLVEAGEGPAVLACMASERPRARSCQPSPRCPPISHDRARPAGLRRLQQADRLCI